MSEYIQFCYNAAAVRIDRYPRYRGWVGTQRKHAMELFRSTDEPLRLLRTVFGHASFRLRQEEVIDDLLAGRDAMVLMPTGGGKSLCYQVPALMRDGVGVVVSPLIALMKDQVDALRQCGVRAACLNSTLDFEEVRAVEAAVNGGKLDLLYIAPERLLQERWRCFMAKSGMIRARVEQELKRQAEELFSELGLSATEAITLFYKQVTVHRGLPFDVRMPNAQTLEALGQARDGHGLNEYANLEDLKARVD